MNLEERLRTAVTTEADRIEPDENTSLGTIRARGRAARRRRRLVGGSVLAVAVAAVLAVSPQVGDDSTDVETINQPRPSVTTTVPETTSTTTDAPAATAPNPAPQETTTSTSTPETSAPVESDQPRGLWPGPEHPGFTDPTAAARSFVQEFVGLPDPALSAFRLGATPSSGQIDVYSLGENGEPLEHVASTLTLHEDQGAWTITEARADDVVVDSPAASAQAGSPLTVQGRGRSFEGTIHVEVRAAGAPSGQFLAQATTTAGCCEVLVPFTATLSFTPPAAPSSGALVVTNDTGLADGTVSFTALPILFT